jgi:hypothetical protein
MSAMSRPVPAATHQRSARCKRVRHGTDSLYQSGSPGHGRHAGPHARLLRRGPQGVIGTIAGADWVIDGDNLEVAWGRVGRRTPWVGWLTEAEYEVPLIELSSRGGAS